MTKPTIAAILTAAAAHGACADDWPCYRGPNRTGVVAELKIDPLREPVQVWKTNVGPGRGSASIVADKLYVLGRQAHTRKLHCFDAATGDAVWTVDIESYFSDSTPTVAAGKVYVIGAVDEPKALCFDAASGDKIWEGKLPKPAKFRHYGHAGSPVIAGDLVLFNVGYGAALNRATGEQIWGFDGLSGLATPVLFKRRGEPAVAFFCGDKLVARDLNSGAELWSIPWKTNLAVNAGDPVFLDGDSKLFVCSGYGLGRALFDVSGASPRELWKSFGSGDGHPFASGFSLDGKLYGFTTGFGSINLADGSRGWGDGAQGSALVLGGQLLRLTERGEFFMGKLGADGIDESMRAQVCGGESWNVPAYWKGLLYVRNQKGDLNCLRIAK